MSLEHDLDAPVQDLEDQLFGMTHRENLDFWLNSIHSGAPSAPILVVCTKLDLVGETVSEAQRDARVAAIEASIRGKPYERQITSVLCVSSKTGEGMDAVRAVLDDTSRLQHYGDEVPLKWFKWKSLISEIVARDGDDGSNRRISHKQAVQMAGACGIDESDVDEMLAKFHSVGFLLWHSGTHDLIVIDPQWMLDRMTELLCQRSIAEHYDASADKKDAWSELQSSGRLSIELLPELWPELLPWERQAVLKYMIGFGHCCPLHHDPTLSAIDQVDRSTFLVPTLLPEAPADASVWAGSADDKALRVCFITSHRRGPREDWPEDRKFLPDTLFFRLVSSLVQEVQRVSDRFRHLTRIGW